MTENWMPVVGYEGLYEVSDLGRVKSLARRTRTIKVKERILKPVNVYGYQTVQLCKEGAIKGKRIHRLVLETFVGPCPEGCEASHRFDNDRTNNTLDNLCWETRSVNLDRKREHGTHQQGERHGCHRLLEADVYLARLMEKMGWQQRHLADYFGVAQSTMWAALRGKTWSHLV